MQSHDRTAPETTRDMILQLVAYIKQMNYQANQANTNWSELLALLARKPHSLQGWDIRASNALAALA